MASGYSSPASQSEVYCRLFGDGLSEVDLDETLPYSLDTSVDSLSEMDETLVYPLDTSSDNDRHIIDLDNTDSEPEHEVHPPIELDEAVQPTGHLTSYARQQLQTYMMCIYRYEEAFLVLEDVDKELVDERFRVVQAQVRGEISMWKLRKWKVGSLNRFREALLRRLGKHKDQLRNLEGYFAGRNVPDWETFQVQWEDDHRYNIPLA